MTSESWRKSLTEFRISRIRENEVTLTILLIARSAPWSDVASHFEMKFGHAMPKQRSIRRRGLGDVAFAKGATADLSVGTPGKKFTIISGGRLS